MLNFLESNLVEIYNQKLNIYQADRKIHSLLKKLGLKIDTNLVNFNLPGYEAIDRVPKYFGALLLTFMRLFEVFSIDEMLNYREIASLRFISTKGNIIRIVIEFYDGLFYEVIDGGLSKLPKGTTSDMIDRDSVDVLHRDYFNTSRYAYFYNRNYINHSNNRVDL
jgi:hypothetical protein